MPSQIQAEIRQIDSIESPFFRDLLWLVYSPNIASDKIPDNLMMELVGIDQFAALWNWYEKQEKYLVDPSKVKLPLGKYAEELILYFLKNTTEIDFIDHSILLIDNKITLGEIDYLFKRNGEPINLELAIKYYLHTNYKGKEVFLGPSTNDWFERKIIKLTKHQLQLTTSHTHLLPEKLQQISFNARLMIKGALFFHISEGVTFNQSNCGWWLHINDIDLIDTESSYAIITEKRDWIFPFNSRLKRYSFAELKVLGNQLLSSRNEIMVDRCDAEGYAVDRGFVVRKNWPD